jgi:single-stranded DNA-binding protein
LNVGLQATEQVSTVKDPRSQNRRQNRDVPKKHLGVPGRRQRRNRASVTIAKNEFFNDGEGERQQVTTFVDVTVWGKSGESFASLAKKGQEVIIEGRLRRNDWESEDGQKHSKHFLRAESWQRCVVALPFRNTTGWQPRIVCDWPI